MGDGAGVRGWRALADLALPLTCAGCGGPGSRWCPGCADLLARELLPGVVTGRLEGVPVLAAGDHTGALRRLVTAYKDGERRDLRPLVARVLVRPLTVAVGPREGVPLVVAPSRGATRRQRGDSPVADAVRAATRLLPGTRSSVADVLRVSGAVRDQTGLGRAARAANLAGRVRVRPGWEPPAGPVWLVDDVVTTGATATASVEALRAVGCTVAGVVSATRVL
ncbi:ComF family protein [Kytococcus aerolatus]|uniref:ComF family protein n=1 Tax=Kytococcus aerolatus TaxID=592308 RepID=UPI00190E60FE|nr:ComF family protein [Kytococcus aerolatus]